MVSPAVVERLPTYLNYLRSVPASVINISSASIAHALGLGEVLVRKDLAAICDIGKPKVGYCVTELICAIEDFLGYNRTDAAIILGAGKLGRALLDYDGFSDYGMNITAAFDIEPSIGTSAGGKPILSMDELPTYCRENHIRIGIIAVPASQAQEVCDRMIDCGIRAILNFAPIHLIPRKDVLIKNENFAISLALLSKRYTEQLSEEAY
jgi:redox-sensing transcriptional repressor